jgi:hypothetical protein
MIQVEIKYSPVEAPWTVVLPDGRRVEFHALRDAKAFCRRQGFEPRLALPTLRALTEAPR